MTESLIYGFLTQNWALPEEFEEVPFDSPFGPAQGFG